MDVSLQFICSVFSWRHLYLLWALGHSNGAQGPGLRGCPDHLEKDMVCGVLRGHSVPVGRPGYVVEAFCKMTKRPNHALQRTRPSRSSCNRGPSWAGSLSVGR